VDLAPAAPLKAKSGHSMCAKLKILDTQWLKPIMAASCYSWRIRIVPFLFASHMYDRYRFDESWDGQVFRISPDMDGR
jgi:hypothetical protein